MAEIDAKLLKSILTPACRLAFAEIRAKYDGESYYCMGLLTSGLLGWLAPIAMTEEELDRVVRRYQTLPAFATESPASLRASLRWNPSDSALREVGLDHFTEVNVLMAQIYETLAAIDIHHGWGEFEEARGRAEDALCDVLILLDQEGIFGSGEEREKVFVTILMFDQDDSILHIGRRLNPTATVEQFEREWTALNQG